jgi:hypothetical protein
VSDAAGYPEAIARERGGDDLAPLPALVPYTQVHRRLRYALEAAQDMVVAGLCALLLALRFQMLWRLGRMALVDHAEPAVLLSQVVLVLILGEYPAASVLAASRIENPNRDDRTLILADLASKAIRQVEETVFGLVRGRMGEERGRELARTLSEGRWTHDHPLTVEEAQRLGLPVRTGWSSRHCMQPANTSAGGSCCCKGWPALPRAW